MGGRLKISQKREIMWEKCEGYEIVWDHWTAQIIKQFFRWNRSKYQYFSIYRYFREKIDIVSNLKFLISPITNQHKRRHISATPLFYIKTLLIRKLRHFIIQIVATPKTKINSSSTIVGFPGHFGISFQPTTKVTTCPYHFSSLLDIERIFLSG